MAEDQQQIPSPSDQQPLVLPRENQPNLELRQRVWECIEKGEPIGIPWDRHGDNMIRWWVAHQVLLNLAKEEYQKRGMQFDPLHPPQINLALGGSAQVHLHKVFEQADQAVKDLAQEIRRSPSSDISASLSFHSTLLLSSALNVRMTYEQLHQIPQPLPMDYGPLRNFDRDNVLKEATVLDETEPKDKIKITIIQSGSLPWKRFTDEQVKQLVQVMRNIYGERCFITVISDKKLPNHDYDKLDGSEIDKSDTDFGADCPIVEEEKNFSTVAAHCTKRTDISISTDSFLGAHFFAGCQAMRLDHQGKLLPTQAFILYTISDKNVWGKGLTGAHLIESPVGKSFLDRNLFYPRVIGIINPADYIKGSRDANDKERVDQIEDVSNIFQRDIRLLIAEIQKFAPVPVASILPVEMSSNK